MHGRKAGTHSRAVAVPGRMATRALAHGRAWWRTVSHALWHRFAVVALAPHVLANFRLFEGPSFLTYGASFGNTLGSKLGFSIASINPFRRTLD